MQKRYQVFVSSTFEDLKDERREIMQALLELRCFPAGMELFPASNETAWNLIKRVIDDSDYYIIVVAGRYGSIDPESKISYTEKEFDYALQCRKRILAFLHSAPSEISSGKTEANDEGKEQLAKFRRKIEATVHVKYWTAAHDLGAKLSRAVATIKEDEPAEGWVRGRHALTDEQAKEMMNLQMRNKDLEASLESQDESPAHVRFAQLSSDSQWILARLIHPRSNIVQFDLVNPELHFIFRGQAFRLAPVTADGGQRIRRAIRQLRDLDFLNGSNSGLKSTPDAFEIDLNPEFGISNSPF